MTPPVRARPPVEASPATQHSSSLLGGSSSANQNGTGWLPESISSVVSHCLSVTTVWLQPLQ